MKLNPHVNETLELSERLNQIEKKLDIMKNEPFLDIIFKAIIKVGKKETTLDKIKLIKRYLRRCFNVDIHSKAIQDRINNLKSELWS